jgi:ribulose-phosphate 3-epimerase
MPLRLSLGVKTDPIEYRYSFEWLFGLMAEEGIFHAQLGSFTEMYSLPDGFFLDLRRLAGDFGIRIASVFTAHRELGGLFRFEHPAWEQAARRNFERMIEIGALLGADSVGGNPGSVLRDRPETKGPGMRRYLEHMRELLHYAHTCGLPAVTAEPMSCLAEPPTLPDEIRAMGDELFAYHCAHPHTTAAFGYCVDLAHGYADREGKVGWDNVQLFEAALPYLNHIHLKNTDALFNATFGFGPDERARGVVQVERFRNLLIEHEGLLPVNEVVGYLEIGGPKTGRDYSDWKLEDMLRVSLRYLKPIFCFP